MIADQHDSSHRYPRTVSTKPFPHFAPARGTPLGAHTTCDPASVKGGLEGILKRSDTHPTQNQPPSNSPLTGGEPSPSPVKGRMGVVCGLGVIVAYIFTSLAFSSTAIAETQGRLFFTPQQRTQLDYEYARNTPSDGNSSPVLTVNGIVQKHGGPRTVWINGVAQSATNTSERNPTTQTVVIPGKSLPIKLKVGEKILLDQPEPATQKVVGE